jgi:hypothetical protein
MTVYDKVEQLLATESDRPKWADEILLELAEIKSLLQKNRYNKPKKDKDYFDFVHAFRDKMRADIASGNYPEITYKGRILGINFKGWIYDKGSNKSLPAYEAFEVYRFLYEHRNEIEKYLKL